MAIVKSIELFFQEGSSDKLYHATLVVEADGTHSVEVAWGRRGANLNTGKKAVHVTLAEAQKIFDRVVREKTNKGYQEITTTVQPAAVAPPAPPKPSLIAAQLLTALDDHELDGFLRNDAMLAQQKLDGIRILAHVDAAGVRPTNRNGAPTDKVAQALLDGLKGLPHGSIVDGEVVDGAYWLFDLLRMGAHDVAHVGYEERWQILADEFAPLLSGSIHVLKIAAGHADKRALYDALVDNAAEGIVFKDRAAPYKAGRPSSGGTQRKYKLQKSADVVLLSNAGNAYLMGVHHGPKMVEVGKVFAGTTNESRAAIDTLLAAGKKPVAEVRYLYATDDHQLFQPVFVRLRDDKQPRLCVRTQLKRTNRDVLA